MYNDSLCSVARRLAAKALAEKSGVRLRGVLQTRCEEASCKQAEWWWLWLWSSITVLGFFGIGFYFSFNSRWTRSCLLSIKTVYISSLWTYRGTDVVLYSLRLFGANCTKFIHTSGSQPEYPRCSIVKIHFGFVVVASNVQGVYSSR